MPDASPALEPAIDLARARTRDGAEIAWCVMKGDGPARFALIHSLAMDHRFWVPAAMRLRERGEVLLWDCRGHGASAKGGGPYTVDGFADDLAAVMDAAGWSGAVVAGASMGGTVALAFADRHPERVQALGLFDTTAWYGEGAPEAWEGRARKAAADGLEALVGFQRQRWFSSGFAQNRPDVVETCVQTFLANDLTSYMETCRMLGHADVRAALPGISAPVRILVGSEDYATPPAMAEAMRAAIPGARMQVLGGAAHLTPLERTDEVAAALVEVSEAVR